MEYKKNQILLGIIGLLLAVYFIGVQRAWFVQGNLPFVMLGGALLLLYTTKQKKWALWVGLFIFALWGYAHFSRIPRMGGCIIGVLLFLVPGVILLHSYEVSGKENYIIPGCFGFWAGCYMMIMSFSIFSHRLCSLLFLSLGMVVYTSKKIRKKRGKVSLEMARGGLLFSIGTVLLGYL